MKFITLGLFYVIDVCVEKEDPKIDKHVSYFSVCEGWDRREVHFVK